MFKLIRILCIKMDIIQGYTTMLHGQPIIKIFWKIGPKKFCSSYSFQTIVAVVRRVRPQQPPSRFERD
jgi:hypothetical protein